MQECARSPVIASLLLIKKIGQRHGSHGQKPCTNDKVVLRMTYRLRILADLPNMVDTIRERRLSYRPVENLPEKGSLSKFQSVWRSRATELCKPCGNIGFVKKLLINDLLPDKKVIIVTDLPVIFKLGLLIYTPYAKRDTFSDEGINMIIVSSQSACCISRLAFSIAKL